MGIHRQTKERFLELLQGFVTNGLFVITHKMMKDRFEGSESTLDRCIKDFLQKGWLTQHTPLLGGPLRRKVDYYIIRPECPVGIESESFEYIFPLQIPAQKDFFNGRLCYGYSTALHFHRLMPTIMGRKRFICHIEPSMIPPKGSENWEFNRRTKMPRPAFTVDEIEYFIIRRSERDFQVMKPESLVVGPRFIYVASALRSLIDAWNHPVFSEGDDRLMEAWQSYLTTTDKNLVGELMRQLLKESMESRKGFFEEFGNWLKPLDKHLASVAWSFT